MASLLKRNGTYYLQWYAGKKIRRRSLRTSVHQIAKEKLRQFESARLRGDDVPLPTRTPIAAVITAYVEHIRGVKTAKSAQTDVNYLREAFGPICPALEITSRSVTEACRKRPRQPAQDRRARVPTIEAPYLEAITTADVAAFISAHTRARGLAPKTANRYREIIVRLFNWSMKQYGVRMPRDKNPAAAVKRCKEPAPARAIALRPSPLFAGLPQAEVSESLVGPAPRVKAVYNPSGERSLALHYPNWASRTESFGLCRLALTRRECLENRTRPVTLRAARRLRRAM